MLSFFSCKKPRRSRRLEDKDSSKSAHPLNNLASGPTGNFEILPLEMKYLLFSYLPVDCLVNDLSILAITSKIVRDLVQMYLSTEAAHKRVVKLAVTHSIALDHLQMKRYLEQFQGYGFLMKRLTCLYPTKERLPVIQAKFQKYICADVGCPRPDRCPGLSCFGRFLRCFTAGWEDRECVATFDSVAQWPVKQLNSLVKQKPGHNPHLELHVRVFFRRVFLDDCQTEADKSFWLNLILKPYAMVDQARILFLLFGPSTDGFIQWYDLCEKTPSTKLQTVMCFGELANAFQLLHKHSHDWTEDAVISVIDELMCSPDDWLPENVAGQLYLCGDSITVKVLTSKALNGRICELSAIILSLCLVCSRQRQSLLWTINVVRQVCQSVDNRRDRRALLKGVIDAFQTVILELHEFSADPNSADAVARDLQNLLDVQASFIWEIMQLSFVELLSK